MLAPTEIQTGFPCLTAVPLVATVSRPPTQPKECLRHQWVASGTLFAMLQRRRSSYRRRSWSITWPCAGGQDELVPASQAPENSLDLMAEMRTWWETLVSSLAPGQQVAFSKKEVSMLKQRMVWLHNASEVSEKRAAQAEEQLQKTGADLALVQQEKQLLERQLQKARKQLELLTRYSEDLEDERDAANAKFKAKQKEWKSQTKELRQLLMRMQKSLGETPDSMGTVEAQSGPPESPLIFQNFMDATVLEDGLIPVSNMTLKDLQEECVVRGLSTDGGLAQVRGRVRVARAKERKDAK